MKLCVGFMFQNEADWLKLHMPVWMSASAIDGVVAVDGGSSDGGGAYVQEWVDAYGGVVVNRPWDWKPLDQENAVIQAAEDAGYDAILFTAPDELWHPVHLRMIKALLSLGNLMLQFPTYNFVRDRRHYSQVPPYYPDLHQRAWLLNRGIRHVGELDSIPNVSSAQILPVHHIHMYHYSHIKPREGYTLKGLNFHRVKDGLSPMGELPADVAVSPFPPCIPFSGLQPLDPDVIGDRAPLE